MLKERGLKYWGWLVHNAIVTSIAEVNNDSQTTRDKLSLSEHVVRNPVIGMIRFEMDSEEENINTGSGQGELVLTLLSAMAQQESENISSHVLLGLKIKRQRRTNWL